MVAGSNLICARYRFRASRDRPPNRNRLANPYDNAKAERFMRTLKDEEVNGKAYRSIEEARRDIGAFIEDVYNTERLHSALGYQPPVEFEDELRQLQTV